MTFIEIEKLCSNVIEDDKINKEECNNKKSDIMTGMLFANIMINKYKLNLLID